MTRLKVKIGFREGYYISEANHQITRSVTALSLKMLRKRLMVIALQGRKAGEEVAVTLLLDNAAQRECDRRRAAAGL